MKIGILTLPLHTNYGGILQAWALQTVLERMGHEVKVINKERIPSAHGLSKYLRYIKRTILKYLLRKDITVFYDKKRLADYHTISQNTQTVIDSYIHSLYVDKLDDLRENTKLFDAIVVGSDQIWRPNYINWVLRDSVSNAFLAFAQKWNIKRVSYAASFGTDEWEYNSEQTKNIIPLIQKFNSVSVREKSGRKLCLSFLGVKAEHVLDPTMLLDKQDYISTFGIENEPESEGNLMVYVLDENESKRNLIKDIARQRGLKPFTVGAKVDDISLLPEARIQPKLQTWLRGFYDAEFIVTDSFHACVFSILFGKPFIAVGNSERGMSRFESLLGQFGLTNNLVPDNSQYDISRDYTIPPIAYQKLEEWRNKSMSFLTNSLS